MNYKIISILMGNNENNLYGTENDVILMYNLFYNLYTLYPYKWTKPFILLNTEVNLNSIIKIINNFINDTNIIFIIYFSGHSNKKGFLKFNNKKISSEILLYEINNFIKNNIEIYFILDCCYGEKFIIKNNFNKINKISYLVSCKINEYSKEMQNTFNLDLFKYKNINSNNNYYICSIFTYYFVQIIKNKNYIDIDSFKNILNEKLWIIISNIHKQTVNYKEYLYNYNV